MEFIDKLYFDNVNGEKNVVALFPHEDSVALGVGEFKKVFEDSPPKIVGVAFTKEEIAQVYAMLDKHKALFL